MREPVAAALWLNFVMLLATLSLLSVPVMAPVIAADLGLSPTFLGTYIAALWASSMITSVTAGSLIARYGAMRVSQGVLLGCAAALGCAGFFGTVWALVPAAILIGCAQGAETPASSALLARITPRAQQTIIFSLKQTGTQLGGMIAGVAFPLALAVMSWQAALLTSMAVLVLAAISLEGPRRRFDHARGSHGHAASVGFRQACTLLLNDGRLMRLAILAFSFVAVQVCLNTFLVAYLVAERHLPIAVAGPLLAAAQVGGLAGRLVWGLVSGRYVRASHLLGALGVGMLVCSAAIGLYGTVMPVAALGLLAFLFGLTASGWNGIHLAEISHILPPQDVGRMIGVIFIIGTCGIVLGPLVFSAIATRVSFATAYVVTSGWALIGLITLVWPAKKSAVR